MRDLAELRARDPHRYNNKDDEDDVMRGVSDMERDLAETTCTQPIHRYNDKNTEDENHARHNTR